MTNEAIPDLRHGRCPSCGHGEVVETPPAVRRVEGHDVEELVIRGIRLELWTCTRCGLAQLSVRDPALLVRHGGAHARFVRAAPPEGTFDVRIVGPLPTEKEARLSMESKIAHLLGIDYRRAAMLLDGPLPIVLARDKEWNAAEHARALLARVDIAVEIAPSAPAAYR